MLMQGWVCPVCGAGVSPFVEVCPNCRKYYYIHPDINTPPTPWKPTITCTATGSINTTNTPNVHCGGLVGTEKCSASHNKRTVALIHEARKEARRLVNSLPENLRKQFTLKI